MNCIDDKVKIRMSLQDQVAFLSRLKNVTKSYDLIKSRRCAECLCYDIERQNRCEDQTDDDLDQIEENFLHYCGICKIVSYCSKECQSKNWRNHKDSCHYVKELQLEINELEKKNPVLQIFRKSVAYEDIELHKKCNGICLSFAENTEPSGNN